MMRKIAKIEDINVRGYRGCGICMFYNPDGDNFCQCRERVGIRKYEMQHTFCRWNLSWDEFNQIYDPYIM
jgi:hypothetical protein